MDRSEHLQWCKDRALEYANNGLKDSINLIIHELIREKDIIKNKQSNISKYD